MRTRVLFTGIICVALASPAAAATPVPANADASRQGYTRAPAMTAPTLQPATPATSGAPTLDPQLAAERFILRTIKFTGATAWSEEELARPFADAIGREISVADLFKRMADVQQMYLDAGYTLSHVSIPQQDIRSGDVTIRVVEGFVASIEIAPELAESKLAQHVAKQITRMRPLNTRRLERLMLILSARPGREATAVLAAPETPDAPPGAVHMLLRARGANESGRSFVSIDNHGSKFLGPWRLSAGYRRGALFGSDADVGLAATVSLPTDELKQAVVDATTPAFGASGATVDFSAGQTLTQPGGNLATLEVDGVSRFALAGLSYPVILQRDETFTIGAAFEYKNVATDLLGSRIFDDRLRTLSMTTSYQLADRFSGTTQLSASYVMGFDILGTRSPGATNVSRADGKSDFRKATAAVSRVQALPAGIEAALTVEGQYAWDPLLSSEEFGYGGQRLGRGYDASALVGDRGVAGALELRKSFMLPEASLAVQPYTFYDLGKVWNIDPSAKDKISGASAGLGIRGSHASGVQADIALAVPLTTAAEDAPGYASSQGARAYMQLRLDF